MARLIEDYPNRTALRPVGTEFRTARETAAEVVEKLVWVFGLGAIPHGNGKDAAS
jgi:hypothetical protein